MALTQLNLEGHTRIEVATNRLWMYEPPDGYYLAFSGGKDSIVLYDLAVKAGVRFDAHYSQGGIDPPELVQFIREYYPAVIRDRPKMSVWQGIARHGLPRRQARWCCELIKEHAGSGRAVLTGIRWAESVRRKSRRMVETSHDDKTKTFVHPIIDWQNNDIWEYIHAQSLPYCSLYDEGFKRLGCVLCPMETATQTQVDLKRWPKIADAWKRACYRYWENHTQHSTSRWTSPEDFWQWWLSRKNDPETDERQPKMFEN